MKVNMSDLIEHIAGDPEPTDAPKHKKSAGEMVFDRTVYTGIGFGVNEVSSLWITDQFMHGKNLFASIPGLKTFGKWFSEEGYTGLSDKIAKTFKIGEKLAKDGSKITPRARGGNALLMVTLLSGGTLLILPMKWLEDSKNYWVKKANHLLDRFRGDKLTPEEIATRDTQVEQDIACMPRQSWPSMLAGRLIAMCASVSSGTFLVGAERNKKLMDWSEKRLTGTIQPEATRNFWHRQARLLSVETYSCAISSITLEIMSKLFAKRSLHVHDPEICHNAAPIITPAPAGSEEDNKASAHCERAGGHCAKIHSQRTQAAGELLAMQV